VKNISPDCCNHHTLYLTQKKKLSRLWGTSKSQLKSVKCLSSGYQSRGAVGPWPSNMKNDNQVPGKWAVFKNLCRPLRLFGLWYFSICIMYIYIYIFLRCIISSPNWSNVIINQPVFWTLLKWYIVHKHEQFTDLGMIPPLYSPSSLVKIQGHEWPTRENCLKHRRQTP